MASLQFSGVITPECSSVTENTMRHRQTSEVQGQNTVLNTN